MNTSSAIAEILKRESIATQKYLATDISGKYVELARALGGYIERVNRSEQIAEAIKRGIEQTKGGNPASLEFITCQETRTSRP
jgi:acetolactate synthase-1/2/3 large subunit